jgi:hypothetical protein
MMNKILIKFKEAEYKEALTFAEKDLQIYNSLLKKILLCVPDFEWNISEFPKLIENPTEFAFDKVVEGPLTIGGVPVSKEKAMGLVEMPKEWLAVIESVKDFQKQIAERPVYRNPGSDQTKYPGMLTLSDLQLSNDSFELTTTFSNKLKESYSVYAQNENQVQAFKHLQTLYKSFIELQKLGVSFGKDLSLEEIGFSQSGGIFDAPYRLTFDPTSVILRIK